MFEQRCPVLLWLAGVLVCSGLFTLVSELSGSSCEGLRAVHGLFPHRSPLQLPATEILQVLSNTTTQRRTGSGLQHSCLLPKLRCDEFPQKDEGEKKNYMCLYCSHFSNCFTCYETTAYKWVQKKKVYVTHDDYMPCERMVQIITKALKLSILTYLAPTAFINEIIWFCHLKGATSAKHIFCYISRKCLFLLAISNLKAISTSNHPYKSLLLWELKLLDQLSCHDGGHRGLSDGNWYFANCFALFKLNAIVNLERATRRLNWKT